MIPSLAPDGWTWWHHASTQTLRLSDRAAGVTAGWVTREAVAACDAAVLQPMFAKVMRRAFARHSGAAR